MPTQAEVEQFRLTPEQTDFQKRWKKLKTLQSILENETLKMQQRARTLKSMWGELTGEFDKLQLDLPQEPVKSFEGMEPGTERAADSSWSPGESLKPQATEEDLMRTGNWKINY